MPDTKIGPITLIFKRQVEWQDATTRWILPPQKYFDVFPPIEGLDEPMFGRTPILMKNAY